MNIGMIAGEISADILGAGLIQQLQHQSNNSCTFVGVGGEQMVQQGLECLVPMQELTTFGIVEAMQHLPRLLRIQKSLKHTLLERKLDVFIGIDLPDFNIGIERYLKKNGICVVHYVSPTVWAWRQQRVHQFGKACNLMLCMYPFEPEIYQRFGYTATFVGHPLADAIPPQRDQAQAKANLQLQAGTVIALLAGSRSSEVNNVFDAFYAGTQQFLATQTSAQIVIAAATQQLATLMQQQIQPVNSNTKIVVGKTRQVLAAADIALVCSGTATLEACLLKVPMVVGYKMHWASYLVLKMLVRTTWVAQPNWLADECIAPELLQSALNSAAICQRLTEVFARNQTEKNYYQTACTNIYTKLRQGASTLAARAVLEHSQQQ